MLDAPSALIASTFVNEFIDAGRAQGDLVIKISAGGIAAVLATSARVLGLKDDLQLTRFRHVWFLGIPLCAFVISFVAGYWTFMQISGLRYELLTGTSVSTGKAITDASLHFRTEYLERFQIANIIQIMFSLVGTLSLAIWFSVNVAALYGGKSHVANAGSSSASDIN